MAITRLLGSIIIKDTCQITSNQNPVISGLKCFPGVWRISKNINDPTMFLFAHECIDPTNINNPSFISQNKLIKKFYSENKVKFSCEQNNKFGLELHTIPGNWGIYSINKIYNWTKLSSREYKWFLFNMEEPDIDLIYIMNKLLMRAN